MGRLISMLVFCLLTACATVPDAIVPPPEKVVKIDPSALKRCQRLLELPINATYEEFLVTSIKNFELAADCARKQDLSIKLLKEFANIKE